MILGRSGRGKTTLALELLAYGGELIADDGVECRREGPQVALFAPEPIRGLIEARGIGLLRAPSRDGAQMALVVDLERAEPERLPPFREIECLGLRFPLIWGRDLAHLAPAIRLYLQHGRAQ